MLIFSQWTSLLDIMEWFMQQRGHTYVRLDGSTAVDTRLTIVDSFNEPANGIFAFLLSTRAGGQGLNLTGADTVILHDVDFNPQVDRQAEDRCHRLGQTRPVSVYRRARRAAPAARWMRAGVGGESGARRQPPPAAPDALPPPQPRDPRATRANRLITRGTVDRDILEIANRKLRLDQAVLADVTVNGAGVAEAAGGRAGAAVETRHMGAILAGLLRDEGGGGGGGAGGGAGGEP